MRVDFYLYSDTHKYATGSSLYQILNGKPKLIALCKVRDFLKQLGVISITELELCSLAINIASFSHLLKG